MRAPNSRAKKDEYADLKKRLLFLFLGILVYRLGVHVPVPGVDTKKLLGLFQQHQQGILGIFNMFSGGALSRFTVFALGVMPYISSSICMQLMTSMVPKLEQLKKEGDSGRRKINQYTRFGTLVLALFQGLGISTWLVSSGMVIYAPSYFYFIASITLVTGTMFLMWLGEQITEKGIGNGISLIIFCGIVSNLPHALSSVLMQVRQGQMQMISLIIMLAAVLSVTAFVVFVERAQRRITIHYAKRQSATQHGGVNTSHLPLKINMAGVIPPIFATAIIVFPNSLINWLSQSEGLEFMADIGAQMAPGQPLYLIFFASAIFFFCFFYTAMIFNPKDTANDLKRGGGLIPGIRPGEQSALYLDKIMGRLTLIGAIYLILVALVPEFMVLTWHVPFYFGGTSLLIVVVVVMDFMVQLQTHLMSQKYEGLIRKRQKR
jgi:preprotein translocase subunit SecY